MPARWELLTYITHLNNHSRLRMIARPEASYLRILPLHSNRYDKYKRVIALHTNAAHYTPMTPLTGLTYSTVLILHNTIGTRKHSNYPYHITDDSGVCLRYRHMPSIQTWIILKTQPFLKMLLFFFNVFRYSLNSYRRL